ncbi:pentapeptide repeat-containing protein [[Phormidium] sp. ETS-05]|uniref:pentapeptide repeat-containing protein n=1 Tax=[Phormidium] sp. ETS-05 TaxID=222819 RepID=UPI001E31CAB4|nr:pentapeptide repeat-containing protein [[Phormidium] sp. ETS-05]
MEIIAAEELLRLYRRGEREFLLRSLCDANLLGARLRGVNLMGADLIGSNLSGADLRGAP